MGERRPCAGCKWLSHPKYASPYCLHWMYALPAEPRELRDGCWTPREDQDGG